MIKIMQLRDCRGLAVRNSDPFQNYFQKGKHTSITHRAISYDISNHTINTNNS